MRLFLAIDLDPGLRGRLEAIARELRPLGSNVRWLAPDGLHLTLRFFGEVPPADVSALSAELGRSLSGASGFRLRFRGSGVFPDRKRPRVLWVGVEDPPPELMDLQSRAERAAREAGFLPERRKYDPHLTVARIRGPEPALDAILKATAGRDLGSLEVPELVLFESRLSPKGASYHAVEAYPLTVSSSGGISGEGLI